MLIDGPLRRLLILATGLCLATLTISLLADNVAIALLGSIVILISWLGFSAWSFALAILSFRRKTWRRGLVSLALPLAVPLGFEVAALVNQPVDALYFMAMRPWYDQQVARLPKNGKRYAEFSWGGMTYASQGVVYDETDEVRWSPGSQSAAWRRRLKDTDLTCGGAEPIGEVKPLGGHYYLTTFGC